jgi:hypothetical protein
MAGYLFLQLLPRDQFVHPLQKNLAMGFALFNGSSRISVKK